MLKKYFICFLAMITILFAGRGEAFVPQTPHLLHLVVKKIRIPQGMIVSQTRRIAAAVAPETGEGGDAVQISSLKETLSYLFPDRLRSEIVNGNRFYALSGEAFVRVENRLVTGLVQAAGEYYTDPLLYRDHEHLSRVLAQRGINTGRVTLQRLEGEICWFIGDPPYGGDATSGLWIGKDSFFPKRYLIQKNSRTIDVRYGDWRQISRSWYPGETRIIVDGELFAHVVVDRMALASGLSPSLFDVEGIKRRHPKQGDAPGQTAGSGRLEQIDTFNQLYD